MNTREPHLGFDKVPDANFGHDGDGDGADDVFDHRGVALGC